MKYELSTSRLILRPLDISDAETVHEYASDDENTTYMYFLPNKTMEETRSFLEYVTAEWQKDAPATYEFAVVLDGVQIGAVSVAINEERTEGEMGWIINKRYWHKGYAYEAACAVRDFALNVLKLPRLIAQCDYRNENSYKLMEKLGFTLEAENGTRTYPKSGEIARELTYAINK
jgi:ribosomal-protein-alanine N-acetyltransferase